MRTQRHHAIAILALLILAFTVVVSVVGFWKFAHYRYRGLDLAIYTNVLYNLAHGGGWWSSIQGHSYLGDHIEPILLALVPFFRAWPDPRLLIVVQALALGLSAVPVYLLLQAGKFEARSTKFKTSTKHEIQNSSGVHFGFRTSNLFRVSDFGFRASQRLCVAGLYLLNPLLWNAALHEFHALAFAPLALLSGAVAYQRRRFGWFLLALLAACAVREDVALIVAMFGIVEVGRWWHEHPAGEHPNDPNGIRMLRILRGPLRNLSLCHSDDQREEESRSMKRTRFFASLRMILLQRSLRRVHSSFIIHHSSFMWILAPLVLGATWFVVATRIAAAANPAGHYAYLVYYGWIGDSFGEILLNILAHPLIMLRHITTVWNVDMAFGLLLPFVFLPLLKPQWLLLALPPLASLLLTAGGGSAAAIEMQYALLFVPALALASVEALRQRIPPPPVGRGGEGGWGVTSARRWLSHRFPLPPRLTAALLAFVVLGAAAMLGPWRGISGLVIHGASLEDRDRRAAYDTILAHVPSDASVAASDAALPHIAARREASAIRYAVLGIGQYASSPYALPDTTAFLIVDARDALAYAAQFFRQSWTMPYAAGVPDRFRAIVRPFAVIAEANGIALLARGADGTPLDDAQYLAPAGSPRRGGLYIDALRDVALELE